MEDNFLHKVYNLVNNIIHLNELKLSSHKETTPDSRRCPITGLDISMQPKNSKFISYTGVKWYYEHDFETFKKVLASRIQHTVLKEKDVEIQFREIAHHVRNCDSNPRNNTRRAIMKIVNEKNCLFNNMELIDKNKLKEAGYINIV